MKKKRFYEHFLEVLNGASDLAYNLKDRIRDMQSDLYGFDDVKGALDKIDELEARIVSLESRSHDPSFGYGPTSLRLDKIEKRLKLANDGIHCVDPGGGGPRGRLNEGPHVTVEPWNVDLNKGSCG